MARFSSLRGLPTLTPLGPERPLSTGSPPIASGVLADGDVALLHLADAGVPPRQLAVQRFTADGRADGDAIDLGTVFIVTAGFEVEGLSGGGLVAAYAAADTREARNEFAIADASGSFVARGGIAADAIVGTGAAVAALPDGGFAFLSASRTREGDQALLTFQRFTAGGDPAGEPLTVAELTGPLGSGQQIGAPEAVAANGGVRVFWTEGDDLHTALVETDGDVADRRVLSDSASGADAARLEDGRVVATWTEGGAVVGAVLGASGRPTEFRVGDGDGAQVVALDSGGWAISWREDDGDILGRAFGRDGRGGDPVEVAGDFVGTASNGEVLALRETDTGAVLTRYAEVTSARLPDFDLDLSRLRERLDDLFARLDLEWAF